MQDTLAEWLMVGVHDLLSIPGTTSDFPGSFRVSLFCLLCVCVSICLVFNTNTYVVNGLNSVGRFCYLFGITRLIFRIALVLGSASVDLIFWQVITIEATTIESTG